MREKDFYKVAIVGYGLAGASFHAPLIKTTEGLNVAAIVTRSPEKQQKAAADFPEAVILDDFDKLLSRSAEFDLAVIATPNREHVPQAKACLEAGLAVVVDKPVAVSSAQCRDLIACAGRNKALLSVFQNRRWDNDFLTLKKLIADGCLGKIMRFESRFERYRPAVRSGAWRETLSAEEGGGILFDLGAHLVDQAVQLFGMPDGVYAEVDARREGVRSDDDAFVALSFPSGVKAHLWCCALSASAGCRFRVMGTLAAYEKYGLDPQEEALRSGKTPAAAGWGKEPESCWGTLTSYEDGKRKETAVESVPGRYESYYQAMYEALRGKGTVPVSPQDALSTLQILETARSAAQSRKSTAKGL